MHDSGAGDVRVMQLAYVEVPGSKRKYDRPEPTATRYTLQSPKDCQRRLCRGSTGSISATAYI